MHHITWLPQMHLTLINGRRKQSKKLQGEGWKHHECIMITLVVIYDLFRVGSCCKELCAKSATPPQWVFNTFSAMSSEGENGTAYLSDIEEFHLLCWEVFLVDSFIAVSAFCISATFAGACFSCCHSEHLWMAYSMKVKEAVGPDVFCLAVLFSRRQIKYQSVTWDFRSCRRSHRT